MSHAVCNSCAFYEDHAANAPIQLSDAGLCRVNPPVSQTAAEGRGIWPIVQKNDWCGKYATLFAAE